MSYSYDTACLALYQNEYVWDALALAARCGWDLQAEMALAALRERGPIRFQDFRLLWDVELDELLRWWPTSDVWLRNTYLTIFAEVRRRKIAASAVDVRWQKEGF